MKLKYHTPRRARGSRPDRLRIRGDDLSYSYYTATSSTDTSWVSPTGSTSVKAVNFGSAADTTFGGVTWLTSNRDGGPWGGGTYNEAGPIDLNFQHPVKDGPIVTAHSILAALLF